MRRGGCSQAGKDILAQNAVVLRYAAHFVLIQRAQKNASFSGINIYVLAPLQLGHLTALIFPSANSQMMTLFLAHVAAELSDYFIVMLVDRAGWHMSHHVTIPENICLLPQLADSPELNPTEHLWEDLRENETANRHFDALEHLENALCAGINRLASNPERLRSITNFPYMKVSL